MKRNHRFKKILNELEAMIDRRRRERQRLLENDTSTNQIELSFPEHMTSKWLQRLWPPLRFIVELAILCHERLEEHKASQMAAALTYRTIFALVPVIILGMLGFKLFGNAENAYEQLSKSATQVLSYDVKAETPEAIEFKENINNFIQPFILEISNTKLQNIGIVGGTLFVWAALSFFVTAEQAANEIFGVRQGRTWDKRIVRYWTLLTLGPLVCVAGIFLAQQLYQLLSEIPVIGQVAGMVFASRSFVGSWLVLFLFTLLMPKCKVSITLALLASAFVALIWMLGRWGFSMYVGYFLPYSKLYGTIGLIPLALLWLYLNWYVALFGMVLTQALQTLTKSITDSSMQKS